MAGRVCVVGSANLDLIALAQRLPKPGETVLAHGYLEAPGGKGLNQAVAAARAGAHVSLVAAVGADSAGASLVHLARDEGIDTGHVRTLEGAPTGRALIAVDDDGQNLIVVVPGANGSLDVPSIHAAHAAITGCDVLLLQHEVPEASIAEALAVARAAGVTTVLNPAPARTVSPEILGLVDYLVPNEHELPLLGEVFGVRTLIVTEGERGSYVVQDGWSERVHPFTVEAIDSVAAGDAFCGTLAASLATGLPLQVSLERASAAGALATTAHGAVTSLPTAAAVDALIERGR